MQLQQLNSIDIVLHLGAAALLGAAIGLERQWRQKLIGLRTNALVSLGAATFILFGTLFEDPTKCAAQVVTGIGFLGAGIIFREGLNVHGINTAATLWCSAAVGVIAGAGAYRPAIIAAVIITIVNLLLRPIVKKINDRIGHQEHAHEVNDDKHEV